jgi:hypothetical protein
MLVGAIALLLPGCVTTTAPQATDEEKQAATTAMIVCLRNAAHRLDDGKSDATTIAIAMNSACTIEYLHQVDVYLQFVGDDPVARQAFADRHRPDEIALATSIVLEQRNTVR